MTNKRNKTWEKELLGLQLRTDRADWKRGEIVLYKSK